MVRYGPVNDGRTCNGGKECFTTRSTAVAVATRQTLKDRALGRTTHKPGIYYCPQHKSWHTTSNSFRHQTTRKENTP